MKKITFLVPEDAAELVTELVEKLGGCINIKSESVEEIKKSRPINGRNDSSLVATLKKEESSLGKNNLKPQRGSKSKQKSQKERIDHTYLFGKWKEFDIDARKLREESW